MTQFIEAMTALGKIIAANSSTETAAHLATIDSRLASIDAKETTDEAVQADTTAGLQALLASANGSSSASGTPSPAPVATPAPTTAPAS